MELNILKESKYPRQRETAAGDTCHKKQISSSLMNTNIPSVPGWTGWEIILLLFYWRTRIVSISISITDSCSVSLSVERELFTFYFHMFFVLFSVAL